MQIADVRPTYPLTALQQGMLAHHLRAPRSGTDVEQIVCTLPEQIDVRLLREAWRIAVGHHEVLRTAFRWSGQGAPVQEVVETVEIPLESLDWADHVDERVSRLRGFLGEDRARGLDPAVAPMFRLTLLHWGEADYQLVWTFQHAILDGRSFTIVLQDLFGVYDALQRGETPVLADRIPFRRHAEWLAAQDWSSNRTFWQEALAGVTAPTPLPGPPQVRPTVAARWGVTERSLSPVASRALEQMALEQAVTVNTLIQGAWALLLASHAATDDVVFGVVRACRHSSVAGADRMVGLLINTLPLRLGRTPDRALGDWLRVVRARWDALRPVEQTPLAVVQGCSAIAAPRPMFETAVMYEGYDLQARLREQGDAGSRRGFELHEQNGFALTLTAYAGECLSLRLEHDTARYDAPAVDALLDQVVTLLLRFPAEVNTPVAALSALSGHGHQLVLEEFNATARPYSPHETLIDLLEDQARRTPDAVAVVSESARVTYAELHRQADRLAHWLQRNGAGPGVLIGVAMERSADLMVALLAVLKSGSAYVPLDPDYPLERLAYMLADSEVPVLLTQQHLVSRLPATDAVILAVDADWPSRSEAQREGSGRRAAPADAAYMIYTSGSTGQPKGAINSHRGIVNRLRWMQDEYQLTAQDVVLQKTPVSFDVSVWELFWPLLAGARLVMARPGGHRDPEYLHATIDAHQVTVLHFVPSMLRLFLAQAEPQGHPSLRELLCSGEALPTDLVERCHELFGQVRIHNLYGPTEAAVDVSSWHCLRGDRRLTIPIGRPIANTRLYVLDGDHHPVPIGVPGELWIGGDQVATGYHRRPALTAERFLPDPFVSHPSARMYRTGDAARWCADGTLEYLGRLDQQVKWHGQRLELGELEALIAAIPGVAASAAAVRSDGGIEHLVVYYVTAPGSTVSEAELRSTLSRQLPAGLLPTAYVALDALSVTPNGKLDRGALPAPGTVQSITREHVAPRSPAERVMTAIWESVLRRASIGVTDNFFELGGDSLLMIQVVSRARAAGYPLTLAEIFEHPTIAELMGRGPGSDVTPGGIPAVELRGQLTPVQEWFFAQQPEAPGHWNQAFLFAVPADLELPSMQRALDAVIHHHEALRYRFAKGPGRQWRQAAGDTASVRIETRDLSAVPEHERAEAITAVCARVQAALDLGAGPLIRVVHLKCGDPTDRLLIVVHHLVTDGVSWRILLEDLEAGYRQAVKGFPISLPVQTASMIRWAAEEAAWSCGPEMSAEREYWRQLTVGSFCRLPLRATAGSPSREGRTHVHEVGLDREATAALLSQVPSAFRSRINDALLSALSVALAKWLGNGRVVVELEGHGREPLPSGLDISRTIGWFTSLFPVVLELEEAADPVTTLIRARDQLRTIPGRGLGYGIARYLASASHDPLGAAPAEILFNYLGQLDALVDGTAIFSFASESEGPWRAAEARRTHPLQIDAMVRGGAFRIRIAFDETQLDASVVEQFAGNYLAALQELVHRSRRSVRPEYRPSDFPLAGLDGATLEAVFGDIPDLEDLYPLAPIQELFLGGLGEPLNDPGFEQWVYRIHGPLDPARLRTAWERAVAHHEILRTGFHSTGIALPLQAVHGTAILPWREVDLRGMDATAQRARQADLLQADRAEGFTAERPPLMRITLVRLADDEFRMVWTHHHILLDRWSWGLLLAEVGGWYQGHQQASPALMRYRDFVQSIGERDQGAPGQFWSAELGGFTNPLELPREAHGGGVRQECALQLSDEEWSSLRALAAVAGVQVHTIMQGAWSLWLAHRFDADDVVSGLSVSGRSTALPGIDRLVGVTINNLPLRARVSRAAPLSSWLRALQHRQVAMQDFVHVRGDALHRWAGLSPRRRLFDTLVVFQDDLSEETAVRWLGDGLEVGWEHPPTRTGYPLTLVAGGRRLSLVANNVSAQFLPEGVAGALVELRSLLRGMAESGPEAPLSAALGHLPSPPRFSRGGAGERFAGEGVAPRDAVETIIARIWGELLEVGMVGVTDDFFALGGQSLLAQQVVSRIREVLRQDVGVRDLFAYPTVEGLAGALRRSERKTGQLRRVAELVLQVEAMSQAEVQAATLAADRTRENWGE